MILKAILYFFLSWGTLAFSEQPTYITFPSDISWKSQSSTHFTAVFRKGREALAVKVLSAAEKAHTVLTPIFPEGPGHTWIVVADFKDSLNGYALNFPYSHIVFFASPPSPGGQLASLDDWIYSVILHEYVHILHIYPASGLWKLMRTIFGTWVVPNGLMPSHLHEGLATFLETELTHGGRGRGSLFNMYRRMAVLENTWGKTFSPPDLLDGSSTRWPYGASPYFFGYQLYETLWKQKGKQGIYDLTLSYSSNFPYFINTPLEKVFKTNYPDLWAKIYDQGNEQAQIEITKIKQSQLSELNYLTSNRSFKGGLTLSPDKTKVAFVSENSQEPGTIKILDLATKKEERVTAIGDSGFSNLCWLGKDDTEQIIYISQKSDYGYEINELLAWNFKTKTTTTLSVDGKPISHVHRLDCSSVENTLLIYQDENERGKIVELTTAPNSQTAFKILRSWQVPERQWVTGLLSGKGAWMALREQLVTHLYQWSRKDAPQKIATIPGEVFNLKNTSDPLILEAIADIDGRHELWKIDTTKKTILKKLSFLGGINSFQKKGIDYLVSNYRDGGFDIAWAKSHEPLLQAVAIPPIKLASDIPVTLTNLAPPKNYQALSTLRPHTWVPSLLFVPDGTQVGLWIPGFDLTQTHLYDIIAGYDSRGLPFGNLGYTFRFGKTSALVSGLYFSPSYLRISKSFFKRWGGRVGFNQGLPWGLPASTLSFIFNRLESSPLGPAEQSLGLELSLTKAWGFPFRKQAISPIDGVRASFTHAQYLKKLGSDKNFFTSIASLSIYVEAPWWKNSAFYLGNKLGYTEGSSFINSFFEGGGELLFSQGRGFFLNRGFFPSLFAGRRMFATNLEYRFPIKTIERGFKLFPFFLRSVHGALVADTLSYDRGSSGTTFPRDLLKKFYTSFGVELKSDWKFGYYLPTQIRMGAYHGLGPFGENLYLTLGVEAGL